MKPKAKGNGDLGIVVFGKDEAGKPHASAFTTADAELAAKAAGLMGMQVLRPVSDAAREVAAKLPKGRVFASGRGFVPFVQPRLYDALQAAHADPQNHVPAADIAEASTSAIDPPTATSTVEAADLVVGSEVLAPVGPQQGWWEAVVIKVKGDLLTLRWRDFPDDPTFARRRNQVARFDFANAPSAK